MRGVRGGIIGAALLGALGCSETTIIVTDPGADGGADTGTTCAAPRLVCADTCIEPTTDRANCGACDAPCGDTEYCSEGACVACKGNLTADGVCVEKLFTADAPRWLRVDGTNAYWGSFVAEQAEGVYRRSYPVAASNVAIYPLPHPVKSSVGGLDLRNGLLYWTITGDDKGLNGSVFRLATPGSSQDTPTLIAGGQGNPRDVVVGDDAVFWANHDTGEVDYARLSPFSAMGAFSVGYVSPEKLALTSKYLVVLDTALGSKQASVVRVALAGGSGPEVRKTLVDTLENPTQLAANEDWAYWSYFGELWEVPLAGGTATRIWQGTGTGIVSSIVTDGTSVYWSVRMDSDKKGLLLRKPVGGDTIVTLAEGPELDGINALTLDAKSIFWGLAYWPPDGGVMRATPR